MSSSYKLLYFNIGGRGEVLRVVLRHAGVEFEDKIITFDEWPQYKSNPDWCPTSVVPVLTTPCGKKLVQTLAILRYLGNELNLYGKTNLDKQRIDAMIDFGKDIYDRSVDIIFDTPDEELKKKRQEELEKIVRSTFTYYESIINENKGSRFIGDEVTIADIYFVELINVLKKSIPGNKILESFPILQKLNEITRELPNIKKHYQERKYV